jgi:hypothetical protein
MTNSAHAPLLDTAFLKSELHHELIDWRSGGGDARMRERLEGWTARFRKRETQAEGAFTQVFFAETWGYLPDGAGHAMHHLQPKFPIKGAGAGGNQGEADLGIGLFGPGRPQVPQVICEFKDVSSNLDAPQKRKGNDRSPVMQAKDYLWGARRGVFPNDPIQPRWALVTDMNEFRLYWVDSFPDRYLRFVIGETGRDLLAEPCLLDDGDNAQFERFLFWRLLKPDMLLAEGGRPQLERLIEKQGKTQGRLEDIFYDDYRDYRRALINGIMAQRPANVTPGGVVRLAQKLLDRLIFVMFAEDMGMRVGFPANELTQQLRNYSSDNFLRPTGHEVWDRLRLIFEVMNVGGDIAGVPIHCFNGGLFATDPDIEALRLPNSLFVLRGQGQSAAPTEEVKQTLFYLATTYNFAAEGERDTAIGLYTLGHIFEQSITELEKLEAEADDRQSLTVLNKRKLDGVYYTPEWVVTRIVEETLDPIFAAWRKDSADAAAYLRRLRGIRIVDPACGSGAFLIAGLRHLRTEMMRAAAEAGEDAKEGAVTEHILSQNLYGVDINPASVEIAKLSLWLHTAKADGPLSSLDKTVVCGNSLVSTDFLANPASDLERERLNAFDWKAAFPAVFENGGFDAVIGNPPYVKLQNLKKADATTADWLASDDSGYRSTRTGNFDLYLPFIERGLWLLNDTGRMGYIAPNLWPTLEHGAGLRQLVAEGRNLARWIDFRSHQVFEEATIYTSIQIFSKAPSNHIEIAFVGDGDVTRIDWTDADNRVPWDAVPSDGAAWRLTPAPVRALMERLDANCTPLGDAAVTESIFQGIITSADHIFHLRRIGNGIYLHTPKGKGAVPVEVRIEDALMKPLVSGAEAKRFVSPDTDTYLLFPYAVGDDVELLSKDVLARDYPCAWNYLRGHEKELRERESGKFDDNCWYRMGRTQNLDKQERPKLVVPRLVARMQAFADENGEYYCDNVDVGGVLPANPDNAWFLLGVMNSRVINFLFSWSSKPFRGDYLSANKQFIAPLPVPRADDVDRATLGTLARAMQSDITARVVVRADLAARLARVEVVKQPLEWLLPDVRSVRAIEVALTTVKSGLRILAKTREEKRNLKQRVDAARRTDVDAAYAALSLRIAATTELDATQVRGSVRFLADGAVVAEAFVSDDDAALILAQWQSVALTFDAGVRNAAKKLIEALRRVALAPEKVLRDQIIALAEKLEDLTQKVRKQERDLHEITCALFDLSLEERLMVELGR